MRKLTGLAAAGVMAAGLVVGVPSAASAHARTLELTYFLSLLGTGSVNEGHTIVTACDRKSDGRGIRTKYTLENGGSGYVADGNGNEAGCGAQTVGTSSNRVVQINVVAVENNVETISTNWQYV